jgi:hypothetical protein
MLIKSRSKGLRVSGRLRVLYFCSFAGAETSALGILIVQILPIFQERHLSYIPFPAGLAMMYAANSLQKESLRALRICPCYENNNEDCCVHGFSDAGTDYLDPETTEENIQAWLLDNQNGPWVPLEFLYMGPFPVDTTRRVSSSSGSISSKDEQAEEIKSTSSSSVSADSRTRSI